MYTGASSRRAAGARARAPASPVHAGLLDALVDPIGAPGAIRPIPGASRARALPSGCRFHPRCAFRPEICDTGDTRCCRSARGARPPAHSTKSCRMAPERYSVSPGCMSTIPSAGGRWTMCRGRPPRLLRRRRCRSRARAGRGARPGGRVGQRQDDARARRGRSAGSDRRRGAVRRPDDRGKAAAGARATHRDRLPGSVRDRSTPA